MEAHKEKSYPVIQFLDSLNVNYEKLLVQASNKYDVKSALHAVGGYLNTAERNKIDEIILTVILREMQ